MFCLFNSFSRLNTKAINLLCKSITEISPHNAGGLTHIYVPGHICPRRVSTLSTSLGRSPGTRSMDGNTSSPRPVPARSKGELWPSPCWRGSHWPPPPLPARALCLRRRRLRTSASPGTRSRQCLQQEVSRAPWSVSYMCTPPRCRPPPP